MLTTNIISNVSLKGNLTGASGTFKGRLEVIEGFFGRNIRLRNGKIEIVRSDGAVAMNDRLTQVGYSVSDNDPHYMTAGRVKGGNVTYGLVEFTCRTLRTIYGGTKGALDERRMTDNTVRFTNVRDRMEAVALTKHKFIHSSLMKF